MAFFLYLCTQMQKTLNILLLLAFAAGALAVPATPEPIIRLLPDGTTDTVYLHGDEYHHFYTDRNGLRIAGSDYEDIALIEQNANFPHRAPKKQMLSSFVPLRGNIHIPVILVNFSDLSFSISNPKEQFDDLFNGAGGSNPNATGSVHDYYMASSDSALNLEYEVFGPYTLSKTMEYYGQNSSSGGNTNHTLHARDLVIEAVSIASQNGVDFSLFDANNDGYIDNVSIVVAGYNEAEGGESNTIWPHYSTINSFNSYSGKYISGYLMISEYRGSGGKVQAGIGTYCHEFGHALGLPDLYNTQQSDAYTVGSWDIMCSGSYNNNGSTPPSYTAFERFMLGWLEPEQLFSPGMRTLKPIETANHAYLIAARAHNMNPNSPSPSEFFLLENRQEVGWDAGKNALVASGLLISHITFSQTGWEYNTFNNHKPLGFDIVSAGFSSPSKSSEADVFPGSTLRTSWIPTLNDGSTIDSLALSQIRQRGDLCISMQVGASDEEMLSFDREQLNIETTYLSSPVVYDTGYATLHIPSMHREYIHMHVSTKRFRFSPDNGAKWYAYPDTAVIPIIPDSAYDISIAAVYTPLRRSCDYEVAFLSAETADGEIGTQLTLSGQAPRPMLITTPVIDSVTNLTSSSFNILWEPQDDADGYFYMLYTVSEGNSEEIESFDSFENHDTILMHGWSTNFQRVQSNYAQSGKAILFEKTDEYIISPHYLYAPSSISVWLSNNYTPISAGEVVGGFLLLSGSKDGVEWEDAEKIYIQRTTKNATRTIELDTTRHWRQFRLSYTHIGGKGGAIVDTWRASLCKKVDYIYRLGEYYIGGASDEIVFRQLTPATTYYYVMQAYEEKGCDPHYSSLSEPFEVSTRQVDGKQSLKIVRSGTGLYSVILPESADGKHCLAIYNSTGTLITLLHPFYGDLTVSLPPLAEGQLYLVKYYSGSMKRKDLSTKIISY